MVNFITELVRTMYLKLHKQQHKKAITFFMMVMVSIFLFACGTTKKEVVFKNDSTGLQVNNGDCPNNGNCGIEIKKGSYTIETDATGAMYPLFNEAEGELIEFTYEVPAKEGIVDGDYKETIMFLVPADLKGSMVLEDASLSEFNLLFNKQCFCRGQAGYRLITKGRLVIKRNVRNEISFDLSFELPDVDIIVSGIKL